MSDTCRFLTPWQWLERRVNVHLVGCGGTGSELLDGLARLHMALVAVGHPGGLHVSAYDPDSVSASNVYRQRFWPGDEGQNKAVLSVHRLNLTLGLDWHAYPVAYDPSGASHNDDLVISCVDRASTRTQIADYGPPCYWLDTGNGARSGQVVLGAKPWPPEAPRLPHVLDLFAEIRDLPDDDAPSCSAEEALAAQDFGVNRVVAESALGLLWQLLRYGGSDHHGAFIQLSPLRVTPLRIDTTVWASLGYECEAA